MSLFLCVHDAILYTTRSHPPTRFSISKITKNPTPEMSPVTPYYLSVMARDPCFNAGSYGSQRIHTSPHLHTASSVKLKYSTAHSRQLLIGGTDKMSREAIGHSATYARSGVLVLPLNPLESRQQACCKRRVPIPVFLEFAGKSALTRTAEIVRHAPLSYRVGATLQRHGLTKS